LKAKLLATLLLVPTILFATIVGERPLWARAVMLSVAAGVMIFIWTKKSK
jgi:branched-subunit amino acid transport protein AzlD